MRPTPDSSAKNSVALFPLHSVLFPGGALPLRIFEARYVDMISDCMRCESPFGVIAINEGSEVGATPTFHRTGTLATIETWDQGPDGLLHIRARGTQRFRILSHHVLGGGLLVGTIETRVDAAGAVRPEQSYLQDLLTEVFAARPELAPQKPWQLDQAAWVAYRLAELLPLTLDQRLELLEHDEPESKLALIARHLEAEKRPPAKRRSR